MACDHYASISISATKARSKIMPGALRYLVLLAIALASSQFCSAATSSSRNSVLAFEVVRANEWTSLGDIPSVAICEQSEVRLTVHLDQPAIISAFIIDSKGAVCPLWPLIRLPSVGAIAGTDQRRRRLVLYSDDFKDALRTGGGHFNGQYSLIVIGCLRQVGMDELSDPLKRLAALHSQIPTPGFHHVENGRVKCSRFITTLVGNDSTVDSHGMLLRLIAATQARLQGLCSFVGVLSFGVMSEGWHEPARCELFDLMVSDLNKCRRMFDASEYRSALYYIDRAVESSAALYDDRLYPHGHLVRVSAHQLRAAVLVRLNAIEEAEHALRTSLRMLSRVQYDQLSGELAECAQVMLLNMAVAAFHRGRLEAAVRYCGIFRDIEKQLSQQSARDVDRLEVLCQYEYLLMLSRLAASGNGRNAASRLKEIVSTLRSECDLHSLSQEHCRKKRMLCRILSGLGLVAEHDGDCQSALVYHREACRMMEGLPCEIPIHYSDRCERLIRASRIARKCGEVWTSGVYLMQAKECAEEGLSRFGTSEFEALCEEVEWTRSTYYKIPDELSLRVLAQSQSSSERARRQRRGEEGAISEQAHVLWEASYLTDLMPERVWHVSRLKELIAIRAIDTTGYMSAYRLLLEAKKAKASSLVVMGRKDEARVAVYEMQRVLAFILDRDPDARCFVASEMFDCVSVLLKCERYGDALIAWNRAAALVPKWEQRVSQTVALNAICDYIHCCRIAGYAWRMEPEWVTLLTRYMDSNEVIAATDRELLSLHRDRSRVALTLLSAKLGANLSNESVYELLWGCKGMDVQVKKMRSGLFGDVGWLSNQLVHEQVSAHRTLYGTRPPRVQRLGAEVGKFDVDEPLVRSAWVDLRERLGPGQAFVDFYFVADDRAGMGESGRYDAFVIQPGRPLVHVQCGRSEPIHAAVRGWRRAITAGHSGAEHARLLGERLWEPLRPVLAPDVDTLYLCPDSMLAVLPWPALPISRRGEVLLEKCALATVPNGDWLVQQLTPAPPQEQPRGRWLVVGDVDFNALAAPAAGGEATTAAPRPWTWKTLPATRREITSVGDSLAPHPTTTLLGAAATTDRVMAELQQVEFAHLATHGFFADPFAWDELGFMTPEAAEARRRRDPFFAARHSPYLLSGLVLAGANRPPARDAQGTPQSDGGLLTAATVAQLNLAQLQLVVLSACDTGWGRLSPGQGALALPRAFHAAGTRNVISTLWQVDDQASAAMMNLFYHYLNVERLPPLQALRSAQLQLRDAPQEIAALAEYRGPNVQRVTRTRPNRAPDPQPATAQQRQLRFWAGYTLSGPGQ